MKKDFENSNFNEAKNQNASWFIVHTRTNYEARVMNGIKMLAQNAFFENQILDVQVPTYEVAEERNGKIKMVSKKYFPTYVFVKMVYSSELWYAITNTISGIMFLGNQKKAECVPKSEIRKCHLKGISEGSDFADGDHVSIDEGALKGMDGKIVKIDAASRKVSVVVSLFGKDTEAWLNIDEISKKT